MQTKFLVRYCVPEGATYVLMHGMVWCCFYVTCWSDGMFRFEIGKFNYV